jgi:predicted  nucleic acid-binding Zn-ribbon protein
MSSGAPRQQLVALEQVRCLECGHRYSKPASGGTSSANPGCPNCGYLGWIPTFRQTDREKAHERAKKAL